MTREEAKHIVDVAFSVPQAVRRDGEDRTYHEDEIREAKNMAIQALSQEPCDKCKYFDGNSCQHYDYKVGYTQGYEDASKRFRQEPCDDAISREAVMKIVDEEWLCNADYDFRSLVEALEQLPPVTQKSGKWIDVNNRLPEERKAVLVYAPERNNIYCAYLDDDTWFIFGGYGSYAVANVTAWMPLPEPYKAESEDKE